MNEFFLSSFYIWICSRSWDDVCINPISQYLSFAIFTITSWPNWETIIFNMYWIGIVYSSNSEIFSILIGVYLNFCFLVLQQHKTLCVTSCHFYNICVSLALFGTVSWLPVWVVSFKCASMLVLSFQTLDIIAKNLTWASIFLA